MQISRRFESHNSSIILNAVRKEKEAYLPFFDIGFLLTDRGRAPCYLDISRGRGEGGGGRGFFCQGDTKFGVFLLFLTNKLRVILRFLTDAPPLEDWNRN